MSKYEELLEHIINTKGGELIANVQPEEFMTEETIVNPMSHTAKGMKIIVYAKEGSIPHCHIIYDEKDICVRLDIAEYFSHNSHVDKMNRDQRDLFVTIMKTKIHKVNKKYAKTDNRTVWEVCSDYWNDRSEANPKITVKVSDGMPKYSTLTFE